MSDYDDSYGEGPQEPPREVEPSREIGFCPLCEVSLSLHNGPDSCSTAQMKARVLDRFYGMFL